MSGSKMSQASGMSYPVHDCSMEDLTPFQSQVAGHGSPGSRSRSGIFLHIHDGYIVKPVEKVALFEKEREAYDFIYSEKDEHSLELQTFLPQYYGVRKVCFEGKELKALALQNLTHGLSKPCVLDVKIGRQTWEPTAPEEKIKIEKGKYVKCRRDLGFCIPGMQYYSGNTDLQIRKHGKEYGKTLDKNGAIEVLRAFVTSEPQCSRILILQFLCKLQRIFEWFNNQDKYCFYSSSLLFVYDANELQFHHLYCVDYVDAANNPKSYPAKFLRALENYLSFYYSFKDEDDAVKRSDYLKKASSCLEDRNFKTSADVKMIDMAHVVIKDDKSLDSNYLEGIAKLIDIFEKILEDLNKSLGIVYLP